MNKFRIIIDKSKIEYLSLSSTVEISIDEYNIDKILSIKLESKLWEVYIDNCEIIEYVDKKVLHFFFSPNELYIIDNAIIEYYSKTENRNLQIEKLGL